MQTKDCKVCKKTFELNESNFYLYKQKSKVNDNIYIFFDKKCLECKRLDVNARRRKLGKGILAKNNEKYLFSKIKTSINFNFKKDKYFEDENDILEQLEFKEKIINLKITDISEKELSQINSDYEKHRIKMG